VKSPPSDAASYALKRPLDLLGASLALLLTSPLLLFALLWWRERDTGVNIDATGVFPDGTKFEGVAGLKKALLQHPEEFVDTVAEKLLMYAIGRNVQYYDAPAVRAIVRDAARNNYTFGSLVAAVVKSTPFQMRSK